MPRWISKDGKWYPAKEHAVLPHLAGTEKEVYDGPDRAALFELDKEKVDYFGTDFKHDPDLIMRVKQLGYNSIDDYAKAAGYDPIVVEEHFKKHSALITKHENPPKKEGVKSLGGGTDTSGQGSDMYGGFGKPKDV